MFDRLNPFELAGATQHAATSGAIEISVSELYSAFSTNDTDDITATLPDGHYEGQIKIIKLKNKDTNNMIVTPENMNSGTTITFDAADEYAILVFDGKNWNVTGTTATVA